MRMLLRAIAVVVIVAAAAEGIRRLCWMPHQCNKIAAELQASTDFAYENRDIFAARGNLARLLPHVERCPRNLYLRVLAGANYQTLGRYRDATDMFSEALRYHRRPELFVWLGAAQHEIGKTEEGVANATRGAMFAPNILEKIPPSVVRQRAYEQVARVMSATVAVRNADFSIPSAVGPKTYEGRETFGPSAARDWSAYTPNSVRTELVPSTRRPGRTMLRVIAGGPNSGITQTWGRPGSGPGRVRTEVWIYIVRGVVHAGSGAAAYVGATAYGTQQGVWHRIEGISQTCPVAETVIFSYEGPAEFYVDEVTVTPLEGECLR